MWKPLLLVFIAVCFSVTGELLLKSGMNQIGVLSFASLLPTLGRMVTHPRLLLGFGFFGLGAIFWLAALSRVPLSWAYPMLAMGYILVLVFSALILKEQVTLLRWSGVLLICAGMILVFRS
jgi:multidrug transporter EmrE-like cation transporter